MNTNKRLERNEIASSFALAMTEIASSSQPRPGLLAMTEIASPARRKTVGGIAMTGIASSSQPRPGLLAMTTSLIITASIIFCSITFCPRQAFAGASVSVNNPHNWDIGAKKADAQATTPSATSEWTITGSADGQEDIYAKVTADASWTASGTTSNGANLFVLTRKHASDGDIQIPYSTGDGNMIKQTLAPNGQYSFGLYFLSPNSSSVQGARTLTVTLKATNWVFVWPGCGSNLVVTHTSSTVAAVSKTVTYGTTSSTLTGSAKCWITQNLGADIQATAVDDSRETAAGWYWQFNRAQGFKHDGTTRTPTTTWDTTNDNTYTNWDPAKDPCALLLGTGWRLPTSAEWTYADGASGGNWTTWSGPYGSALKLHAAGGLSGGALSTRGSYGYYWSSTQGSATYGWYLTFNSGSSAMVSNGKAFGWSARCLKD